jgi:hypothetical protein
VVRYAASVVMHITYGKTTPTSYSDPEVQQVNKCVLVSILPDIFMLIMLPGDIW